MFILRGLKKLIYLAILGVLVYLAAHYPVKGKPLYQVARNTVGVKGFGETLKDLRQLFGGILKSVGEEMQEDVSEQDQKALQNVIEKELKKENQP